MHLPVFLTQGTVIRVREFGGKCGNWALKGQFLSDCRGNVEFCLKICDIVREENLFSFKFRDFFLRILNGNTKMPWIITKDYNR